MKDSLKVQFSNSGLSGFYPWLCISNVGGGLDTFFEFINCDAGDLSQFFYYDSTLQQIKNYNTGLCMSDLGYTSYVSGFQSLHCDPTNPNQQFEYNGKLKNVAKDYCIHGYYWSGGRLVIWYCVYYTAFSMIPGKLLFFYIDE